MHNDIFNSSSSHKKDHRPPMSSGDADNALSRKRLKKEARMRAEEEQAKYWKEKKSEKRHRLKEAKSEAKAQLEEEWSMLENEEKLRRKKEAARVHDAKHKKERQMTDFRYLNSVSSFNPKIVFDLAFWSGMDNRGKKSTVSQLKFSYSSLRRLGFVLSPIFSSFNAEDEMLCNLQNFEGFRAYPPCFTENHWSALSPPENVVYLTADSENVLYELSPQTLYVVGAFVDHNSKKGATLSTAKQYNVSTARLPLDEEIVVGNLCKVLTINHVAEILGIFAATGSWKEAFAALPVRLNQ